MRQKMAYLVKKKPDGIIMVRAETEHDARVIISAVESIEIQADIFEPDTYYIEEVRSWER